MMDDCEGISIPYIDDSFEQESSEVEGLNANNNGQDYVTSADRNIDLEVSSSENPLHSSCSLKNNCSILDSTTHMSLNANSEVENDRREILPNLEMVTENLQEEEEVEEEVVEEVVEEEEDESGCVTIIENGDFSYAIRSEYESNRIRQGVWPIKWYSLIPCLSTVIAMSAICRIAFLTLMHQGVFILLFTLLSIIIGIPIFVFMVLIGQRVGSGYLKMWFISPGFIGVGIGMHVMYIIYIICIMAPTNWMFVYLSDSIVSSREAYTWSPCKYNTSYTGHFDLHPDMNYIAANIDNYYRQNFLSVPYTNPGDYFKLQFQRYFMQILLWLSIAFIVSRHHTLIHWIISVPYSIAYFLFIITGLGLTYNWGGNLIAVLRIDWLNGLSNSLIWMDTLKEVFFDWFMLGGIVLHVCSRNKHGEHLSRFISVILSMILGGFSVAIIMGVSMRNILQYHGSNLHLTTISKDDGNLTSMLFTNFFKNNRSSGSEVYISQPYETNISSLVLQIVGDFQINRFTNIESFKVFRFLTEFIPAITSLDCPRRTGTMFTTILYFTTMIMQYSQVATIYMCIVDSLCPVIEDTNRMYKIRTAISMGFVLILIFMDLFISSKMGSEALIILDRAMSSGWGIIFSIGVLLCVIFTLRKDCSLKVILRPLRFKFNDKVYFAVKYIGGITYFVIYIIIFGLFLFDDGLGVTQDISNHNVFIKFCLITIQFSPIITIFVSLVYQTIRYISKPEDLRMKLISLFKPQLEWNTTFSPTQSARAHINSMLDFQNDHPPVYTPPPSYSAATGRTAIPFKRSCRSLGNIYLQTFSDNSLVSNSEVQQEDSDVVLSENDGRTTDYSC